MSREDVLISCGGEELAAWYYPPSFGAGPTACVLMAHGFTGVRDMHLDPPARRFQEAGYAVVVFDYRGFGDSSGQPRQVVDIEMQYDDWRAVIDWARKLPGIDPDRIVLWGTSFCGGHVVKLAAEDDRIVAVIAQAPMMDGRALAVATAGRNTPRLISDALRDAYRAWRGMPPYLVRVSCPPGGYAVLGMPHVWWAVNNIISEDTTWRNEVAARIALKLGRYRPITSASKVRCPLLVQALEGETVLPVRPAEKAARRAPNGEYRSYAGRDHFDIYIGDGFNELNADQLDFLRRHVPLSVPE